MDALDDALRVISSLNEAGVDYVVIGGVAMNLHGLVRATEDYRMKRDTVRPIDHADAAALRSAFGLEE